MNTPDLLLDNEAILSLQATTVKQLPPMPIRKRRLQPRLHGRRHGNILYMLRIGIGMTQSELARKTGLSRRSINAIENQRSAPSIYTALAIAEALQVSVRDIFRLR